MWKCLPSFVLLVLTIGVSRSQGRRAAGDAEVLGTEAPDVLLGDPNATRDALRPGRHGGPPARARVPSGQVQRLDRRGGCACFFDLDRTLTGMHARVHECPGNEVIEGVEDNAYYVNSILTFSEAFANRLEGTFCAERQCFLGIISAGDAHGANSSERAAVVKQLSKCGGRLVSQEWQGPVALTPTSRSCEGLPLTSTLALGCSEGTKQHAAKTMIEWLQEKESVVLRDEDVYFFDDVVKNLRGFADTGFNAIQVACKLREGEHHTGVCGARREEIVERRGLNLCQDSE